MGKYEADIILGPRMRIEKGLLSSRDAACIIYIQPPSVPTPSSCDFNRTLPFHSELSISFQKNTQNDILAGQLLYIGFSGKDIAMTLMVSRKKPTGVQAVNRVIPTFNPL